MDWTLTKIRTKARRLAGKISTNQLSDNDLDDYINNYYQNVMPMQLGDFNPGWQSITLSAATGTYTPTIDSFYIYTEPVYIEESGEQDALLTPWYDANEFYKNFTREVPSDTDEHGKPSDVLIQHDRLVFRPVPDATYTVQLNTISYIPTALTNDTDQPIKNTFGPAIAYGAAIDIAGDYGDKEAVDKVAPFLKSYLNLNFRRTVSKQLHRRSVPSF